MKTLIKIMLVSLLVTNFGYADMNKEELIQLLEMSDKLEAAKAKVDGNKEESHQQTIVNNYAPVIPTITQDNTAMEKLMIAKEEITSLKYQNKELKDAEPTIPRFVWFLVGGAAGAAAAYYGPKYIK